jgi:hypothetical protein
VEAEEGEEAVEAASKDKVKDMANNKARRRRALMGLL